MRNLVMLVGVCGLAACAPHAARVPAPPPPPTVIPLTALVSTQLSVVLTDAGAPELTAFYGAREFRPVWSDDDGVTVAAREVLDAAGAAATHGLDPALYPIERARNLLDAGSDPYGLALFDVAVTAVWLAYARDLASGRVDPAVVSEYWRAGATPVDPAATLAAALRESRPAAALVALAPRGAGYERLRRALADVRLADAAGGWPVVPPGPELAPGARDARVAALRQRLAASGDLLAAGETAHVFDTTLEAAVQRFQARHGLPETGSADSATLAALAVPAADRARQIVANLERWRWLPRELGDRHVMVNTPAFDLQLVAGGRTAFQSRVIVGRCDWPTPIVSGTITHAVLSPTWRVPASIAAEELVPLVRADTAYLTRGGFTVLDVRGRTVERPDTIAWSAIPDTALPYRFVQAPGPANPLGRVKLVFANPFSVYLHDTPNAALFESCPRPFSHGCVRVERAMDLTARLLDDARWPVESLHGAAARGLERWLALPRAVPVHLVYWTAWVDDAGTLQLRDDLYQWDALLLRALERHGRVTGASP